VVAPHLLKEVDRGLGATIAVQLHRLDLTGLQIDGQVMLGRARGTGPATRHGVRVALRRLRRIRDWLLVAAAISILLIGLSLVGPTYLASGWPGTQVVSTPVPAPAGGRAMPTGMACPATCPIKGNRASMFFYVPGGDIYDATRTEERFASPSDAEAAGYRASQR
jgi:hypothetical protein